MADGKLRFRLRSYPESVVDGPGRALSFSGLPPPLSGLSNRTPGIPGGQRLVDEVRMLRYNPLLWHYLRW